MSQFPEDTRLQDRISQLNVIVARRNEFLRELFHLLRSKEDISSTPFDDHNDEIKAFLRRFDIGKDPERGSISNLTEDEISFPTYDSSSLRSKVLLDSSGAPAASTRTTRSRARVEDVQPMKTFKLPSSEKSNGAEVSGGFPTVQDAQASTRDLDTDEDNDELDLIGSSAFSQTEHKRRHEIRPEIREIEKASLLEENGGALMSVKGAAVSSLDASAKTSATSCVETSRLVPHSLLLTGRANEVKVEGEELSLNRLELSKDKDDAMDVDEVEAITKPIVAEVTGEDPTTASAALIKEISGKPATPTLVQDGGVPEEESLAATASSLQAKVNTHINAQAMLTPTSASNDDKLFRDIQKGEFTIETDGNKPFNPVYTLPPLSILPADFTRKAKPIKRKKDKEREGKRDRDDMVPMGLARWSATLMANPLWRKVSRASKTLSTREWSVAMSELRLIRTIERIELLKNDGRWSFRQPKKQRGVGGLVKSHWDHLMDEVKWMRIDFREERRWKMALAYNLSTAVLEWHFARTPEERQRTGIVVKWKSHCELHKEEGDADSSMDLSSDEVNAALKLNQLGLDYGSEEEEEGKSQGLDPLEPSVAIRDALDATNDIRPKDEDLDDRSVLRLVKIASSDNAGQISSDSLDEISKSGLKSTSENPLLSGSKSSSQSVNGDSDPVPFAAKSLKTPFAPLMKKIIYSDDLFLDLSSDSTDLLPNSVVKDPSSQPISDISTLFPDLQPFGLLDFSANSVIANSEGKKKSEKKSDRDDPTKRLEDVTYTKLYSTGRFMLTKPTLIGPLQPAKQFRDDNWLPIDPQPIYTDMDAAGRISEDISNDLFDGRPSSGVSNLALQFHASSLKDKDGRRRAADHLWSATDDVFLKQLVDRYSTNWTLVTECYNSSRLMTPMEKRTPTDCAERWKERWCVERKLQHSEAAQPTAEDGPVAGTTVQMTTRAVKRLASTSVSSAQGVSIGGEPKRRRRHYLLQDSIKRSAKKRADALQKMLGRFPNQRKPSAIHETHNQYSKLPKYTPLELARMKADRDQRENHEIQLARRRQEEAMRQNLLREQAQRGILQGQTSQQQAQQPSQQSQPAQGSQGQAQQAQSTIAQQQQQMVQLQQLQAQQQAGQVARGTPGGVVLQSRPTRLTAGAPNARPVNPQTQTQILQQARAMQVPMQLPLNTQANLAQVLSQAAGSTGAHLAGNPYFSLPANIGSLTQEQILNAFAMQTGQQHSQPQQQHQQRSPST